MDFLGVIEEGVGDCRRLFVHLRAAGCAALDTGGLGMDHAGEFCLIGGGGEAAETTLGDVGVEVVVFDEAWHGGGFAFGFFGGDEIRLFGGG